MTFHKYPFAYLFTLTSLGVLLCALDFSQWILLGWGVSVVLVSLVLRLLKWAKIDSFFIYLSIVFPLLGTLSVTDFNERHFSKVINEENQWILKVDEFQRKEGKDWNKGIAIIGEKKGSEIIFKDKKIVFFTNSTFEFVGEEVVMVNGEAVEIKNTNNPGEFDLRMFWRAKGIDKMIFFQEEDLVLLEKNELYGFWKLTKVFQKFCGDALAQFLKGDELAIAKALVLGDKSLLDSELRSSFSNTGAMHVLAVSGLHVGIVAQILIFLAQFLARWITRYQAQLIVVSLLWVYALLTGLSPSVVRSVLMFSLLIVAQISGRNSTSINILFISAFISLVYNPYLLFDVGFQLSYGAMLGIFLLNKPIQSFFQPKNKWIGYLWDGTAVGLAAQCMTTPLTLYYFHQFPNYFALTNIGLMVFSGLALGFGLATIAFSKIPFVNLVVAWLTFAVLWSMLTFIEWVEQLPGAVAFGFDIPILFSGLLVLVISFMFFARKVWLKTLSIVAFVFCIIFIVWGRFEKTQDYHVCVFNSNQLLIAVKTPEKTVVLYDDKKPKNKEKAGFLIDSYRKLHPSRHLEYVPLNNRKIELNVGARIFKFTKSENGFEMVLNDKKIDILYSLVFSNEDSIREQIFMPWINHPKSLKVGAKFFEW